jgi:hypothetical protein
VPAVSAGVAFWIAIDGTPPSPSALATSSALAIAEAPAARLIGWIAGQNVPVTARLEFATVTDPTLLPPAGMAPLIVTEPRLIPCPGFTCALRFEHKKIVRMKIALRIVSS